MSLLSLLLLSAVTFPGCLSADTELHHGRSIEDLVHLYNQREGVTYLYKPLERRPPALLQEDDDPERATCIIRETECLRSEETDLSQCNYKPGGEVKVCVLDLDVVDPEDITCRSLTQGVRLKRSFKKKRRRRPSGSRLTGGFTLIGSVKPIRHNKPRISWV